MSGADEMVAWLREAMDSAQQGAEAAEGWSPHWDYDDLAREVRDLRNAGTIAFTPVEQYGRFIAANDPASVLRRVAADRKTLELHAAVPDHGRFSEDGCPADCDGAHDREPACRACRNYAGDHEEAPCATVRLLAEGYGWTDRALCGATTVFWPDEEACDAECDRPAGHEGTRHHDRILGEWDEGELSTSHPNP